MQTLWRGVVATGFGIALMLATAELAVRVLNPTPRAQVVRPTPSRVFEQVQGVVVWRAKEADDVRNEDCPDRRPDARVIALVGDSIFFGWGGGLVVEPQNAATVLQRLLDIRDGPVWCVLNLSEPGFLPHQQLALLEEQLRERSVHQVFWSVWKNEGRLADFGGGLVQTNGLAVDDLGIPTVPGVGLPGVQRALFSWSRLWQLGVLAAAFPAERGSGPPRYVSVLNAHRQVREQGGAFVAVIFPPLGVSFAESEVDARLVQVQHDLDQEGVRTLMVASALVDEEVTELRLDLCCHYNPAGHEAVAKALAAMVPGGSADHAD